MVKRKFVVEWREIDGAMEKKRKLHLTQDDNNIFQCPIDECLHLGFKSSRGLRKHIDTQHHWYFYFNKRPEINKKDVPRKEESKFKSSTHDKPAFSIKKGVGVDFLEWLQMPYGGGKDIKQASQIATRAMKFLMSCMGETCDGANADDSYADASAGSPVLVLKFLNAVCEEWKLRASGILGYVKAILDLVDFRKATGVCDDTLRAFTTTEVYLKRGLRNLSKLKRLDCKRNLTMENLVAANSWASISEMDSVIPYHTPKYKYVMKKCMAGDETPSISELCFATRYIVLFLFLRVKGTRPMTYEHLTLDMVEAAKTNGGYIDSTAFKTAGTYDFDTVVLDDDVLEILDSYTTHIRPKTNPTCENLLVTSAGTAFRALGAGMSLLVHQAIGKYISPTRWRMILETESGVLLSPEEQVVVSNDQKHTSVCAKMHYQKRLSRETAVKGKQCIQKIVGTRGGEHTNSLATDIRAVENEFTVGTSNSSAHPISATTPTGQVDMDQKESENLSDDNTIINLSESVAAVQAITISEEEETVVAASPANESTDNVKKHYARRSSRGGESSKDNNVESTDNTSPVDSVDTNVKVTIADILEKEVKKELAEEHVGLMRFTEAEDIALKAGIKKYGLGKWAKIRKDQEFQFHPSRTRDTLRGRADTLKLTKKTRKPK